ncbi:dihydrolipoamide dehydrogenase [Pontibacter ummariensis]|uniref:Dihydrolipoyl dehydrogenase n=1 Tax=Pontibacter ummariensis TaxID=1610492 RepID=A0A239JB30_9BACT|nr:dihydrolipoyl dehydrogenase [Pontibacter ummariensis]PRY08331.1 dihydrolipoamide dehydrogenase [Pontibacter ummariensis]SNT02822.1 dihydrolipoamide dehydrogenase [Pontibacter ummariensis]
MEKYDVTVIGSGPGGYVAAIRCAQLGMKTALIEKYSTLGGTCLNVGCIPSKAVLDSSERFHDAQEKFKDHGITLENLAIDINKMVAHKADVVQKTVNGVAFLMKKNKVDVFHGTGSFVNAHTIAVNNGEANPTTIQSKNIIIATGSKPSSLPGITIDKKRIISSTEALVLKEIPKHLIIVGGGVIGMELGSVYARIGSKVTVVEFLDSIIASMDAALGKELQRSLQKLGFTFLLGHKVVRAEADTDKVIVTAEDKKGKSITLEGDYCLMAVGRRPYTAGLNVEGIGIATEKGQISVDENFRTNVPNVYAIGDVVRGAMLAHKASEEGVYVAETIAGQKPHINYLTIPNIVYTWPEVASVGYTEEQLKQTGRTYKIGSFPFKANARARMNNDTEGFIKVLADKTTDEILGIHMIGPRASDMIGEATVAMDYRASAEDIARMSHGHPTFYETFKEACLAATENRAIHF